MNRNKELNASRVLCPTVGVSFLVRFPFVVAICEPVIVLLHLDQNEPPGGYVIYEPPGFRLGIHLKR